MDDVVGGARYLSAVKLPSKCRQPASRQGRPVVPKGAKPQVDGGRSGIRTHEGLAPPAVFKTAAFVRSAILPAGW